MKVIGTPSLYLSRIRLIKTYVDPSSVNHLIPSLKLPSSIRHLLILVSGSHGMRQRKWTFDCRITFRKRCLDCWFRFLRARNVLLARVYLVLSTYKRALSLKNIFLRTEQNRCLSIFAWMYSSSCEGGRYQRCYFCRRLCLSYHYCFAIIMAKKYQLVQFILRQTE